MWLIFCISNIYSKYIFIYLSLHLSTYLCCREYVYFSLIVNLWEETSLHKFVLLLHILLYLECKVLSILYMKYFSGPDFHLITLKNKVTYIYLWEKEQICFLSGGLQSISRCHLGLLARYEGSKGIRQSFTY